MLSKKPPKYFFYVCVYLDVWFEWECYMVYIFGCSFGRAIKSGVDWVSEIDSMSPKG